MRLIGSIPSETHAQRFSAYLESKGIANQCELALDSDSKTIVGQIWVADEDKLEEAKRLLQKFQENPSDAAFDTIALPFKEELEPPSSDKPKEVPLKHSLAYPVTLFFLALCVFVFFLNAMEEMRYQKSNASANILFTPIQEMLLYDMPPSIEKIGEEIREKNSKEEIQVLIDQAQNAPYWRGFYNWVVLKIRGEDSSDGEGSLFVKIRQGEIWRIFSPCVLHLNFLHILFNMIWLWVLGRPIEQRIGPLRVLILTLLVGVLTNTAQYLMSGPFFLGYSGVVMGLAGFIWMREKIAPWEGYPLHRSTILFLAMFILAMLILQIAMFFVQIFWSGSLNLNIANTAHIAGALIGALLGRMSFFAWRVR